MVVTNDQGNEVVTVLPITHTPPSDPALAIEVPHATKQRLGMDDERSWVVLAEANRFDWPGPDLRLMPTGDPASVAYGLLPRSCSRKSANGSAMPSKHGWQALCHGHRKPVRSRVMLARPVEAASR